jgi:hypothetical protein
MSGHPCIRVRDNATGNPLRLVGRAKGPQKETGVSYVAGGPCAALEGDSSRPIMSFLQR